MYCKKWLFLNVVDKGSRMKKVGAANSVGPLK
jgi:hypothetical protein